MIYIVPTNLKFGLLLPRASTRRIIIHHSDSPDVSAATIHQWHVQKGWSGIGYHFVIRRAGSIESGRPIDMVGAHAGPEVNSDSIGICLAGNFMEYAPAQEQIVSLEQLVDYLRVLYKNNLEVLRHNDVVVTECPGDFFPWPEKNWPLFCRISDENKTGNTTDPWKSELMARAAQARLITEAHNPNDVAPKWFVLAVGLSILNIRGGNDSDKK